MKKLLKGIKSSLLVRGLLFSTFLLFTMCITIVDITQPTSATVGEEIDITVDLKLNPIADDTHYLMFGFLAPKSWDVEGTAVVTYISSVGNGTMSLAPADEKAPLADTNPGPNNWVNEMTEIIGIGENYGEVKWVVYKSDVTLNSINGVEITGQVQLKVKVGPENLVTQLGYVAANTGYGIRDTKHAAKFTDCMEVTGGTNPRKDLCGEIPNPVTYQPESFSFEDIVKINFDAAKGGGALVGTDQVYLCISAKVEGNTVDICDKSDAVKMNSLGGNLWDITIWPRGLFNVPKGSSISEISYSFKNEAGNIVVQDPNTTEDFILEENCN
ncbi:DUF4961 domain-containing protein [Flavivirga eckloniae]|uniref:DUF4961 domain-containing protein n=1 Tax=Flavivirga eckloniae TaxID=1803846 RepID=A0A2K9PUA2_9FLAO|nr:DUF4961 domain-containing protein [Flavivirga eckloniae]AUP80641.1 hypothetical protein C1H87_18755 [Flavivirga eckloniae]